MRALERIEQWEAGTRLDSWMFKIAQNINIDEARARNRRGTAVGVEALETVAGDDGVRVVEGRSDINRVRQAVSELPNDQRALVGLVILEGKSYKEAAAILDVPIGTVMSRIARARASLNQALQGQMGTIQ
jgi:RNA polymerase sigma-70 factor (ECF subfamily)